MKNRAQARKSGLERRLDAFVRRRLAELRPARAAPPPMVTVIAPVNAGTDPV